MKTILSLTVSLGALCAVSAFNPMMLAMMQGGPGGAEGMPKVDPVLIAAAMPSSNGYFDAMMKARMADMRITWMLKMMGRPAASPNEKKWLTVNLLQSEANQANQANQAAPANPQQQMQQPTSPFGQGMPGLFPGMGMMPFGGGPMGFNPMAGLFAGGA